ncbi:hypothetical protein SAY86_018056 [Trapa natans]|uniref:NPH3 domain-containing protein n=1 Tax=Trapa natans TaxID=22666 RepID=A0AAN7LRD6_TRANT|nr:hypothetical protein SAY86_018056 [Trapa natans]
MKFMKLGSRPDTFYTTEAVRSVSSEVSTDLIIQVKGSRYLLHKFPLLSKCLRLQQLCSEAPDSSSVVQLSDFPGGVETFELCAKFCYGITITLSAYNIVAARCAAEYLQMSEDVEKGNLIYKLEVFFTSCILQGWRDCIVTLQTTRAYPLWSEELAITGRCIDSIASKVLSYPSKVSLSHSQSRRVRDDAVSSCNGVRHSGKLAAACGPSRPNWWAEDLAELGIDLYWRTMAAVKSGGRVPSNLIGDALKVYASRWLPSICITRRRCSDDSNYDDSDSHDDVSSKHRLLLESIISLLPVEKGAVSCGFLLKLLKAANILNVSSSWRTEITRRVALQLEDATTSDLLIPNSTGMNNSNSSTTTYDVDMVMSILEQFMVQGQSPPTTPPRSKLGFERRRRSRSAENINVEFQESRRSSSASHSSKLKVAKIIDGYLQEIARDVNLPLPKFVEVAEAVPDFARLDHDDLYRAIDIYLKAHRDLSKTDRKRLCRILNCKKLSMEVCVHAAQNELLPLRVVVQVLFFEQARAATSGGKMAAELPPNIKALLMAHGVDLSRATGTLSTTTSIHGGPEDQWSVSGLKSPPSKMPSLRTKPTENINGVEYHDEADTARRAPGKLKSLCAMPARPKRMFSKLWTMNRSASEKN